MTHWIRFPGVEVFITNANAGCRILPNCEIPQLSSGTECRKTLFNQYLCCDSEIRYPPRQMVPAPASVPI